MAVELTVELCNDARNIRRTGAVFQKKYIKFAQNTRTHEARSKWVWWDEYFDAAAREPYKDKISYSERLLTLVLDGKKLRTFLYRSQGQGSDKTPVVCIYHV